MACKSISMAVLVFLVYFYTVLIIEKKQNLAPKVHKNTPFWPQNVKKSFFGEGQPHIPPPWRLRRLDSARSCPPQLQLLDPPMVGSSCNRTWRLLQYSLLLHGLAVSNSMLTMVVIWSISYNRNVPDFNCQNLTEVGFASSNLDGLE